LTTGLVKISEKNPRSGWLPKFNGDFLIKRYFSLSLVNFMKILSVVFMWIC